MAPTSTGPLSGLLKQIHAQTSTKEAFRNQQAPLDAGFGQVPINVPKAANGCMAEEIQRLSLKK